MYAHYVPAILPHRFGENMDQIGQFHAIEDESHLNPIERAIRAGERGMQRIREEQREQRRFANDREIHLRKEWAPIDSKCYQRIADFQEKSREDSFRGENGYNWAGSYRNSPRRDDGNYQENHRRNYGNPEHGSEDRNHRNHHFSNNHGYSHRRDGTDNYRQRPMYDEGDRSMHGRNSPGRNDHGNYRNGWRHESRNEGRGHTEHRRCSPVNNRRQNDYGRFDNRYMHSPERRESWNHRRDDFSMRSPMGRHDDRRNGHSFENGNNSYHNHYDRNRAMSRTDSRASDRSDRNYEEVKGNWRNHHGGYSRDHVERNNHHEQVNYGRWNRFQNYDRNDHGEGHSYDSFRDNDRGNRSWNSPRSHCRDNERPQYSFRDKDRMNSARDRNRNYSNRSLIDDFEEQLRVDENGRGSTSNQPNQRPKLRNEFYEHTVGKIRVLIRNLTLSDKEKLEMLIELLQDEQIKELLDDARYDNAKVKTDAEEISQLKNEDEKKDEYMNKVLEYCWDLTQLANNPVKRTAIVSINYFLNNVGAYEFSSNDAE